MASSIKNNLISRPKASLSWGNFSGSTFEQDPRPRCSLIIGDGFTQSLLVSQGLKNKIQMSIDHHFPPPSDLMYTPVKNDFFSKSPIWDSQKWPKLYKFWEDSNKPCGRNFYLSLPKIDINPHKKIGSLSYDTSSLAFELRCYLWHLFRSHHYEFMLHDGSFDWTEWEWVKPFKIFLSEFALGIASFNYDLCLEFVLSKFRRGVVYHHLYDEHVYSGRPSDSIALYKMHGSISDYLNTGMDILTGYNPNPWLSESNFELNAITNINLDVNYKMEIFPELPDIVPPGHYGEDKLNPQSSTLHLSKCHVRASKLVVFCGLSAAEPDTDEIRELIDEISAEALVIHVGLQVDKENMLAKLLSKRGINSTFLLPTELTSLNKIIGGKIPLNRDWSKL